MAQRNSTLLFAVTPLLVAILLCNLSQTSHSIRNDPKKPGSRGGLSLRMVHSDSPDSPTYQPNVSDFDRYKRWISMSESRVHYLSQKKNTSLPLTGNTTTYTDTTLEPEATIRPIIRFQTPAFYVVVGIGQFPGALPSFKEEYLVFDTGSGITWVQCEGCTTCFHQSTPYFPRSQSRTYQVLPGLPEAEVVYVDEASMKGVWATETFTFPIDNFQTESITGVQFACGINMTNFNAEDSNPQNMVTGMLGMNEDPTSFISQLGAKVNYRFSYCFQAPGINLNNPSMFLRFGDDILMAPGPAPTTPLFIFHERNGYFLNLLGLSVNDQLLNIDLNAFAITPSGEGGTMIDSGTTFSYLVPEAFDKLDAAVTNYVLHNNPHLGKLWNPPPMFQNCWVHNDASVNVFNFPSVTFHFQGADMLVQGQQMFQLFADTTGKYPAGLHCLTVLRSDHGNNVIGIYQQVNQRIVMDVGHGRLTIQPADCTHSN